MIIQRNNAPWRPTATANPVWEGTALRSEEFGDIYFSVEDGPAESRYVFIDGNELCERFSRLRPGQRFVIAELGFGTGLNFLLTLQHWREHAPADARLHYIGVDAQPLSATTLAGVHSAWPELGEDARQLACQWPAPIPGCHRRWMADDRVQLDLWWETAEHAIGDLASHGRPWIDAWYLDGFAPARNPDMWQSDLWLQLAQLSRPGATVATFTAAGVVRRGLASAGFNMTKRPGFGRKRECLVGRLEKAPAPKLDVTPWDLAPANTGDHALVIGAGLAGAHVARALAGRGLRVTVLEAASVASGGSSNRQGVTYTRLSRRFGTLSDFALASYHYALPHYRRLFDQSALTTGRDGQFCGYLQLSDDDTTLEHLRAVLNDACPIASVADASISKQLTGLAINGRGIWFPDAAWLHPGAICRALLAHPLIEVREQTGPLTLNRADQWQAASRDGDILVTAPIAVVACAHDSTLFPPLSWLPLQVIRGQTTQIASQGKLKSLKSVVCHQGYLPPAVDGQHCIGASFGPNDEALDEREADHVHNLEQLKAAMPELSPSPKPLGGRVALRCNSNDYLPVAGPATDASQFASVYAPLRHRSKAVSAESPPVHKGLWVLSALGSRGLTAAPLAAETIAAQICDEPPPLPRYLNRAISPARFLERRLKRGEL